MPSAITHAFVGGALSSLAPRGLSWRRVALALAFVSVLPDADVIAFPLGIPYHHPLGHRGATHSLLFAVLLALAMTPIVARGSNLARRSQLSLTALIFLATASHGFLDAFTDAGLGTGFLIPFWAERFFFPFRPLLTSPVNAIAFFRGRGATILANEARWVWLPTGVITAAIVGYRKRTNA